MAELFRFLVEDGRVDPSVASFVTNNMGLQSSTDFANYWTKSDFAAGMQEDVVAHVDELKDTANSRLQVARLRLAWKKAAANQQVPRSPASSTRETEKQCLQSATSSTNEPQSTTSSPQSPTSPPMVINETQPMALTVVIFGATGDLAKKKLYPALYQLMYGCPDAPLLPCTASIVGFGRSHVDLGAFLTKQCVNVKGKHKESFLAQCTYFSGSYDDKKSFETLNDYLGRLEGKRPANRLFFFSVPPDVFGSVCSNVKAAACAPKGGWTRLLVEKPFGRDSQSFETLNSITSNCFTEDQLFRIDHYLGKEVVLNLAAFRFGNQMFESFWNHEHIASIQLIFKEDLGTEGRGGYFNRSGIIRDIMQNHLMQVFLWLAMEPPRELQRDCLQQKKSELLKAITPLRLEDCFLGQFGSNTWTVDGIEHHEAGYLDEPGVPQNSRTPTFAAVVLRVNNDRWDGVPFLMHAGKGLDERKAEVRVKFKPKTCNQCIPGDLNELVICIQPDESIYLKFMNKRPGWKQDIVEPAVLDMSYAMAFPDSYVADGYERMFYNAFNGDGSLFVGSDELKEAWRIFTPLLDEIERQQPQPVVYPFGVRAPPGMDDFAGRFNVSLAPSWQEHLVLHAKRLHNLREVFDALDRDKDGRLDSREVKALARQIYDGREPTEKQVAKILRRMDEDGDGTLTFSEVERAVEKLSCFCSTKYDDHAPHVGWREETTEIETQQEPALLGNGTAAAVPVDLDEDTLWHAMVFSVRNPDRCGLFVDSVQVMERDDHVQRCTRILDAPGMPMIRENCYVRKDAWEIAFRIVEHGQEVADVERVLVLKKKPLRLEVYSRSLRDHSRVYVKAPLHIAQNMLQCMLATACRLRTPVRVEKIDDPSRRQFACCGGCFAGMRNHRKRQRLPMAAAKTKFLAGALGNDGKIYCPPFSTSSLIMLDPATGKRTSVAQVGEVGDETCKYSCITAHSNGMLYCAPFCAERALVYDPMRRCVKEMWGKLGAGPAKYEHLVEGLDGNMYAVPSFATRCCRLKPDKCKAELFGPRFSAAPGKYRDCKRAPNGKLYAPPLNADRVLMVDPAQSTVQEIGPDLSSGARANGCLGPGHSGPDSDKWWALELGNNCKFYSPPCNALQCLEIDPATDTVTKFGGPFPGDKKWGSIVKAPNGKLYCAPRFHGRVLKIDPEMRSATLIGPHLGDGGDKWSAMVLARDGKLYCPPRGGTTVLMVDPTTDEVQEIPTHVGTNGVRCQWMAAVTCSNGFVYALPANADSFLRISS